MNAFGKFEPQHLCPGSLCHHRPQFGVERGDLLVVRSVRREPLMQLGLPLLKLPDLAFEPGQLLPRRPQLPRAHLCRQRNPTRTKIRSIMT